MGAKIYVRLLIGLALASSFTIRLKVEGESATQFRESKYRQRDGREALCLDACNKKNTCSASSRAHQANINMNARAILRWVFRRMGIASLNAGGCSLPLKDLACLASQGIEELGVCGSKITEEGIARAIMNPECR